MKAIYKAKAKLPRGRKSRRKLGILKGKLKVGPEFFEPLPADELACWE